MRATEAEVAHCEPCSELSSSRSFTAIIVLVTVTATLVLVLALAKRKLPPWARQLLERVLHHMVRLYGIPNKLKILIGFYQIATKIELVYGILMPAEVRELLLALQFTISLGIDGIPLACFGAAGCNRRGELNPGHAQSHAVS